jgi:hypothetical protein
MFHCITRLVVKMVRATALPWLNLFYTKVCRQHKLCASWAHRERGVLMLRFFLMLRQVVKSPAP